MRTFERADAVKKPTPDARSERREKDEEERAKDAMPKGRNFH